MLKEGRKRQQKRGPGDRKRILKEWYFQNHGGVRKGGSKNSAPCYQTKQHEDCSWVSGAPLWDDWGPKGGSLDEVEG